MKLVPTGTAELIRMLTTYKASLLALSIGIRQPPPLLLRSHEDLLGNVGGGSVGLVIFPSEVSVLVHESPKAASLHVGEMSEVPLGDLELLQRTLQVEACLSWHQVCDAMSSTVSWQVWQGLPTLRVSLPTPELGAHVFRDPL